jgi:uncharacterized coiled-coil DUF342 family protein
MINTIDDYYSKLSEYMELKDELLEFTDVYHDAMYYDIEGYHSEQEDFEELYNDLLIQVDAVKMLLDAHKNLSYTFS